MRRTMLIVWILIGLLVAGIIVVWLATLAEGVDLPPVLTLPGAQAPCFTTNDAQAKRVTVRCHNGQYTVRRDEQAKGWVIERPDHTISHVPDWQR